MEAENEAGREPTQAEQPGAPPALDICTMLKPADVEMTPELLHAFGKVIELTAPIVGESVRVLLAQYQATTRQQIRSTVAHNTIQARLWARAIVWEAVFIGSVLTGGLGLAIAMTVAGQVASAEKIAFALFGFIGGRGFLHIRGLMERKN